MEGFRRNTFALVNWHTNGVQMVIPNYSANVSTRQQLVKNSRKRLSQNQTIKLSYFKKNSRKNVGVRKDLTASNQVCS